MRVRQPFFSIIIPTYNRTELLVSCLQSLTYVDYPQDSLEVIVVDDGSETPPEAIIAQFRNQLPVKLLKQPNAGPSAARNLGSEHAKGDILAFTDDDCIIAPDWLHVLSNRFADTPASMIGGKTINNVPHNPYSATSQIIIDVVYRHYNSDYDHAKFVASNNLAVTANLFKRIGGFDSTFRFSEDRELCCRWLNHGYQIIYLPEALVYHNKALTLHSFWRQHFNYGRGAYRFHQKRINHKWGNFQTEFKFHLNFRNWLLTPFSQVKGTQSVLIALLMVSWQTANVSGFFWEGIRHKINLLKAL
jgi:GT2 family glycosyltransferase